jgi:uncharacterized protein
MKPIGDLSRDQQALLRRFLASSKRPEGTMTYPQLAGFLFAVCSAPELIRPSEWMPLIFDEQDAGYRDMDQANEVLQALMALYNWTNQGVEERQPALPPGCAVLDDAVANLESGSELCQWARGFAAGHGWLVEIWEDLVPDELDKELGAILAVLSFFVSREVAEALFEEGGGETWNPDEMAASMLDLLPEAMAGYAHMGRSIDEVLRAHGDDLPEPPATAVKIGRNQSCPCGSGLKYKNCCGSTLH